MKSCYIFSKSDIVSIFDLQESLRKSRSSIKKERDWLFKKKEINFLNHPKVLRFELATEHLYLFVAYVYLLSK